MKLYAIEKDGRFWEMMCEEWTEEPDPASMFMECALNVAERYAKTKGGTVVEFTLTRTPEMRVGVRVVPRFSVKRVSSVEPSATFGEFVILEDGSGLCASSLIVLPDEMLDDEEGEA